LVLVLVIWCSYMLLKCLYRNYISSEGGDNKHLVLESCHGVSHVLFKCFECLGYYLAWVGFLSKDPCLLTCVILVLRVFRLLLNDNWIP
jgi:hypothetical protein